MGLCGSSPEGDLLPVQRKDLLEHKALFDFLGFNGKERVRLCESFWNFDRDGNMEISFREFRKGVGVSANRYVKNHFLRSDGSDDGTLSLGEYVICSWNFCTIEPHDFPSHTYFGYVTGDEDSGINIDTMLHLVDEATGILSGTNEFGNKEMNLAGGNVVDHSKNREREERAIKKVASADGKVHMKGFVEYAKKHPFLVMKTINFQTNFQEATLGGAKGWNRLTSKRSELLKGKLKFIHGDKLVEWIGKRCGKDYTKGDKHKELPTQEDTAGSNYVVRE